MNILPGDPLFDIIHAAATWSIDHLYLRSVVDDRANPYAYNGRQTDGDAPVRPITIQ